MYYNIYTIVVLWMVAVSSIRGDYISCMLGILCLLETHLLYIRTNLKNDEHPLLSKDFKAFLSLSTNTFSV